jgi:hypothetical protein
MDNLHTKLNLDLGKKNKIYEHCSKEHLKSLVAKCESGCEIWITFWAEIGAKVVHFSRGQYMIYIYLQNSQTSQRLYFPYFTFRNQTLQFYCKFKMLLLVNELYWYISSGQDLVFLVYTMKIVSSSERVAIYLREI